MKIIRILAIMLIFAFPVSLAESELPTEPPIKAATEVPTEVPTEAPTVSPTEAPTEVPTEAPTETPTEVPTETPTEVPAEAPTEAPTEFPTEIPTESPTESPTEAPFSLSDPDYSGVLDARGELILTEYHGSARNLTIPESIDGYVVAEIGEGMFAKNALLELIELPKTLRRIGDRAFADCTKLESVGVPDAIESVGDDIFRNCDKLKTLTLNAERSIVLVSPNAYRHVRDGKTFTAAFPIAFTDFSILGTLTLDTDLTLLSLGSIQNSGAISLDGTLITCGGEFSGSEPDGSFLRKHKIENGVCTQCGQPCAVRFIYIGSEISKTYDGTTEIALNPADFQANDSSVQLQSVIAHLDSANAGARTVHVEFVLSEGSAEPLELPATITRRALVLTPKGGQGKTYGSSDPDYFSGSVRGLVKGDKLHGALARESGESVGEYAITLGTLRASDNYELTLKRETFTIRPRAIVDTSVSGISNQKYTGSPIEPAFFIRLGNETLRANIDYTAEFLNNIQPGTAILRLTGIGNYAGSRDVAFRILNTGSGLNYTGIESPAVPGLVNPVGTPEGDSASASTADLTRVQLGYADLGAVLFDAQNQPQPVNFYLDPAENALHLSPMNISSGTRLLLAHDQLQAANVETIVYSDLAFTLRLPVSELLAAMLNGDVLTVQLREIELPHLERTIIHLSLNLSGTALDLSGAKLELPQSPALLIPESESPRLFRRTDCPQAGFYLQ